MGQYTGELERGNLIPAYGRDYTKWADARDAFYEGKDFVLCTPGGRTYCSIRNFRSGATVQIRYNKLRKVTVVTVPE